MRYNIFLCGFAVLIFSVLLSVVPSYAVEVGVDSPPNPSDRYYDTRLEYIYGSTIEYNNRFFGSYVALKYEPTYYGSFIAKSVNSSASHGYLMRTYAFVDVTNTSDYLYQLYVHSVYQIDSMSSTSWGDVRDSNYDYNSFFTSEGKRYLVVYSNSSLPDDFDVVEVTNYYNDTVQFLSDKYWVNLTNAEIFELCKNFDHPQLIGEYDSTIPCLVRADVAFSNVSTSDSDVKSGHVVGIVSPLTSQGVLTSDYYIDYQCFFGYVTCQTSPYYKDLDYKVYSVMKYNGGVDLSLFNSDVLSWTESTYNPFTSGAKSLKVSCNTISINMRLRRKSDGAYGDWYSVGINNLGFNESSYTISGDGYKPVSTGYSGIVNGSSQTIVPTSDFDDLLTTQNNPSTTISANGVSLGTSEGGGVLQQGGVIDLITATGDTNYDNILSYLGEVPKLIGVVFGYLPPFFISFITTAFILLVTIGIVKVLI